MSIMKCCQKAKYLIGIVGFVIVFSGFDYSMPLQANPVEDLEIVEEDKDEISLPEEVELSIISEGPIPFDVSTNNLSVVKVDSYLDPKSYWNTNIGWVNNDNVERLNMQVFTETKNYVSSLKNDPCFCTDMAPERLISFMRNVNALMPLALSMNETGLYSDPNMMWSSVIYTKPLKAVGLKCRDIDLRSFDTNTYIALGLSSYTMQGSKNDGSSIGPLQILSTHIKGGCTTYKCGKACKDLMRWEDCLNYLFHEDGVVFGNKDHWNNGYEFRDMFEVMAAMAINHNTGSFIFTTDNKNATSSLWKSSEAVYKFCEDISSKENIKIMNQYVEDWFMENEEALKNGICTKLPGSNIDSLLDKLNIKWSDYATGCGIKQVYPIKALVNYLTLHKLYGC